jgi:branched-chain amino acid transport system permease protein
MEQKESIVKRSWWLALLIMLSLIAPFIITEFYLTILCEALVMSLLALSFNLLFGYMGQLSFGQAAFYGLGGYAVAMLMMKFILTSGSASWPECYCLLSSAHRWVFLCSAERNLLCHL